MAAIGSGSLTSGPGSGYGSEQECMASVIFYCETAMLAKEDVERVREMQCLLPYVPVPAGDALVVGYSY